MTHCKYVCCERERSCLHNAKNVGCIHEKYCRTFQEQGGKFIKSDARRDKE